MTFLADVHSPRIPRRRAPPSRPRAIYDVIPGGLTEADHERIFAYAAKGKRALWIATRIRKHPSTVQWFMYTHGLSAPRYHPGAYERKGRIVNRFTPEEDALLTEMRCRQCTTREIATALEQRFGHRRGPSTIRIRLLMIAGRDEG